MREVILLKYGEIVLKGANRPVFESSLLKEVRRRASQYGDFRVNFSQSTMYVRPLSDDCDIDGMYGCAKKIFGISGVCRAAVCDKSMEDILRTVREYLPFIATENLMMEAVKRGGNRQELHEIIRTCSMAATAKMKEGGPCDLLQRLAAEPIFGMTIEEMEAVLNPSAYIGRCPEQVEAFLAEVEPLLSGTMAETADIDL